MKSKIYKYEIKRDCERKDASTAVPGFGGVLDVVDSLLFAAPLAYILWLWFGPSRLLRGTDGSSLSRWTPHSQCSEKSSLRS